MSTAALRAAADRAVACLAVGSGDDVLIVCNDAQRRIADALAQSAAALARDVRTVVFPALSRHGEEPPALVGDAMAEASAILAPTSTSLSHTRARIDATARGARIATMPQITEDIFVRAVPVDYAALKRDGDRLATLLTRANVCRVTSPAGTDVVIGLDGRTGRSDDGNLDARGAFGNLPAGEGYIAPLETFGTGTIVFDGSLATFGLLDEPFTVTLADGRASAATGEAGAWLLRTLDEGGPTGRLVAELGIGTNPAATLTGNILEDEKVVGTVHLAFGMSASLGGVNEASVHIDGVMRAATVELDGRLIMRDGVLLMPRSGPA
jgi:leucyl aminopeptidase (aminopeptidase T)